MDLGLSEEQEMLKNFARDFLEKECPEKHVREMEEDEQGYSPDLWKKMAEQGWQGLIIPDQYGGTGMGQHRGKGPKGYQRSDDRLKEMICERLRDDPEIDPSEVSITVQGGKVTLDGTVDSRHAKNAIEDVAEQFGVQDVQNNLRVQKTSSVSDDTRVGKSGTDEADKAMKQNKH